MESLESTTRKRDSSSSVSPQMQISVVALQEFINRQSNGNVDFEIADSDGNNSFISMEALQTLFQIELVVDDISPHQFLRQYQAF